jgi:hypothetical protein
MNVKCAEKLVLLLLAQALTNFVCMGCFEIEVVMFLEEPELETLSS